ncbi:MAG: hypothetical protein ACK2U9_19560, partial [Anaerolineae bacterium]
MSHKNHDPKHENHGCPMAAAHRGEGRHRGEPQGAGGHRGDGTSRRTFLAGAGAVALGMAAGCGKKPAGGGAAGGADTAMGAQGMAAKGMAAKGMAPAERRVAARRAAARPAERAFQVPSSVAGRGQVFQAVWGTSLKGKNDLPPREPVEKMVDHLLLQLTGKSKPLDAWATLFSP